MGHITESTTENLEYLNLLCRAGREEESDKDLPKYLRGCDSCFNEYAIEDDEEGLCLCPICQQEL